MGFRFTSSDNEFFDLFVQSAKHLSSGVDILSKIVGTSQADRAPLRDQLHDIEHEADKTKHTIARKLNASFVTPIDREDISTLASVLDDCMDYMDEAGDLITLYRVGIVPESIIRQVKLLQRCSELTVEAMPGLRKMADLRDYWVEINRLENEGDRAYRDFLAELFNSGTDPLEVIKWKDIVETLEKALDKFEFLANTVEAISIKES